MDRKTITRISFAAMFAALTALFITLIHIPYGETGYIHLGDAVILLCAAVLPAPYAIPAAAVGGGLADLFSGFPLYIIPTVIIKSLMALTLSPGPFCAGATWPGRALPSGSICCCMPWRNGCWASPCTD